MQLVRNIMNAWGPASKKTTYYQVLVSNKIGGAAKIALMIGNYVRRNDLGNPVVFGPAGGVAVANAVRELGLQFADYDYERLMNGSRVPSYTESLRMLRKTAFTNGLIHVHSPSVFGAMRVFRRLSGLKTVLHIHLDFSTEELRWPFLDPPDLTIVCAEFMRKAVECARQVDGRSHGVVRVIKNAVDLERFCQGNKAAEKMSLGADAQTPLAMIVANLAPHKGHMTCIRAVAELRKRGCHLQLWVVGESRVPKGAYEGELRAACAELGVTESVRFMGFRTDTAELFRAADFVLLPSTSEGLPLSILEALASGAVVLAAPTAGIPEVVYDDKTGFIVAADDYERYADIMERLISDKQKVIEICEAARRYVEKEHDLREYSRRVVSEYQRLLGKS